MDTSPVGAPDPVMADQSLAGSKSMDTGSYKRRRIVDSARESRISPESIPSKPPTTDGSPELRENALRSTPSVIRRTTSKTHDQSPRQQISSAQDTTKGVLEITGQQSQAVYRKLDGQTDVGKSKINAVEAQQNHMSLIANRLAVSPKTVLEGLVKT